MLSQLEIVDIQIFAGLGVLLLTIFWALVRIGRRSSRRKDGIEKSALIEYYFDSGHKTRAWVLDSGKWLDNGALEVVYHQKGKSDRRTTMRFSRRTWNFDTSQGCQCITRKAADQMNGYVPPAEANRYTIVPFG